MFSSLHRFTRLKPLSAKRRAQQPDRQRCEAICRKRARGRCELHCSPYCVGVGRHAHELLKASQGGSRVDPNNCLWACDICNSYVEDHPLEALKLGLVIRRNP